MRGLFCTYEKTAVAIEYFEIVGLEEVEVFLPLKRLPISEYTVDYRCVATVHLDVSRLQEPVLHLDVYRKQCPKL